MAGLPDSRHPPTSEPGEYDWRYLAGVVRFNRSEYFDAHEVWEALWLDCPAADRRFYQSLIQAAVALYHWGNRNRAGAARLFHSGRRYMEPYRPVHQGLDVDRFWRGVESALAPALAGGQEPDSPTPIPEKEGGNDRALHSAPSPCPGEGLGDGLPPRPPRIDLDPPPASWPNPDEARHE
ncbi:MAG: hypothetical protein JWO38_5630 [Gemmataceae bacterium]|nr:hypothetical protein [Gemmataceae bacterium]